MLAALALLGSVASLSLALVQARAQEVGGEVPRFVGSAAAVGVRAQLTLPGAPLADTLVDAGGPAAQVGASSSGGAVAYAALPDPGQLTETLPGVLTGLLAQGVAGFPPLALPTLPGYPLSITADDLSPTASLGAGPYELRATADGASGSARAAGGITEGAAGRAAALEATAEVDATAEGVIVRATSVAEGLTVGPLVIGQVRSTATMHLEPGATTAERSHRTTIAGLLVGGLPVAVTADALDVAGTAVPLPLGATLATLLAAAGIQVEVLPAASFPDRIVAPALRVTIPIDGSAAGAGTGTATLVLGGATASLTPGAASVPVADAEGSVVDAPSGGEPVSPVDLAGAPRVPGAPSSPGGPVLPTEPISGPGPLVGLFDVRNLYLLLAACALGCWGLGQLVRTLEVRE